MTTPEVHTSTIGYPTTTPAMTMTLEIGPPMLIGSISRGTPCTVVPVTGGKLISHPTYPISLEASFFGTGNDYIHNDPSGRHMRLDTRAVLRDRQDEMIHVWYKGIIEITPELSLILSGNEKATSTEFGDSYIHVEFETGCERYRALELGLFVGAGRFVVDAKRGRVSVEYKLGQVVAGTKVRRAHADTQTDQDE